MEWDILIDAARKARLRSYSPYSRFAVGAALSTKGDEVFVGCNVENRSFGLTLCAERVAIASAVAAGYCDPEAMVVFTELSPPALPCGLCLDSMAEFEPELRLLLVNGEGEREETRVSELLPRPFQFPG